MNWTQKISIVLPESFQGVFWKIGRIDNWMRKWWWWTHKASVSFDYSWKRIANLFGGRKCHKIQPAPFILQLTRKLSAEQIIFCDWASFFFGPGCDWKWFSISYSGELNGMKRTEKYKLIQKDTKISYHIIIIQMRVRARTPMRINAISECSHFEFIIDRRNKENAEPQ